MIRSFETSSVAPGAGTRRAVTLPELWWFMEGGSARRIAPGLQTSRRVFAELALLPTGAATHSRKVRFVHHLIILPNIIMLLGSMRCAFCL
jgi:hypothetical protein